MSNAYLLDGKYINGVYVSRWVIGYPFSENGDTQSITITRQFRALEANYVRGQMGVAHDPVFADAYLCTESNPQPTGIGSIVGCQRLFARVPTPQVTYSSMAINKPDASAYGEGEATAHSFVDPANNFSDETIGMAYQYAGKTFVNNQIYTRNSTSMTLTEGSGGTYTITFGADTTAALAWNAAEATIEAAVNGLASVIAAGITVDIVTSGPPFAWAITLTAGTTSTLFAFDGSSLTPAGARTILTGLISVTSQQARTAYRGTVGSHGFNPALNLLVKRAGGSVYNVLMAPVSGWAVVDANTIAVIYLAPLGTVVGQLHRTYTPGPDRVRVRKTETFYLPGITPGITTVDDIPVPTVAINDEVLLTLVAGASTGYQTYDAEPLSIWMGKIYRQAVLAINIDDL